MVQPHNRHMSISLYISVLAVADTVALILGKWSLSRHYNKLLNCNMVQLP